MYTRILIPTDGSEPAGKAVQNGIALAKRIGAKTTARMVLPPFHPLTTDAQMIEDTPAEYKVRMRGQAEKKALSAAAHSAQSTGVACEMIQVEHEHPYRAIIDTTTSKDCDLIVMGSHGRCGISALGLGSETVGPHPLKDSSTGPSMSRHFHTLRLAREGRRVTMNAPSTDSRLMCHAGKAPANP